MAFTVQAFIADPTASHPAQIAQFVADPTLVMTLGIAPFVIDPTLVVGGMRLPPFDKAVVFPSITGTGTGTEGNFSYVAVPKITAAGTGIEDVGGTSAKNVPKITAAGAGTADGSAADVPKITATGQGSQGGQSIASVPMILASGEGAIAATSSAIVPRILAAAQGYSGVIASSLVSVPLVVATSAGYEAFTGQSINISIPLIIAQGTGQTAQGTTFSALTMHTERQALSTYTNYPFNSFAKFNGVYLASGAGGIFALTGATDAGTFIDAAARVGITDFGTSHLKRVDRLYVGYRTDGNLVLRVFTDEVNIRDYLLTATGKSGLHGNHARIGKGLEARYWQFEIRNQDGADFELNAMEVKPQVLRRRVGGDDA